MKFSIEKSMPSDGFDGWSLQDDESGKEVGWINGPDNRKPLAEALVRAVNSHDDLVSALEEVLFDLIVRMSQTFRAAHPHWTNEEVSYSVDIHPRIVAARAALKKAKE